MRRRTRILAGILSLVAMTFSFTETVLASTCASMADMTAAAGEAEGSRDASTPMDCLFPGGPGDVGDHGSHCPFGLAMGQGCTAAASLPAPASTVSAPPSEVASRTVFEDARHDLLLGRAAFHPPRA